MHIVNSTPVWFALLISACSANLIPAPAISDPTITTAPKVPIELFRKQNDARFIGWENFSGTWFSRTCDIGGTLYQSGDHWRCCATSLPGCNVPVGCISGSLIFTYSTGTITKATYACTDVYTDPIDSAFTVCNTGFLFENTLDFSPETNIACGKSALNWSYYRVKPSDSPSSTPSPTPRSTIASTTSSSTTSAATETATSTTSAPNKKKSQAWIAGVVVGPIVGIALLVGLSIFFFARHKKGGTPSAPPPPSSLAPSYPGSPQVQQAVPPGAFTPYGVAATNLMPKHDSWTPQSPTTDGSNSLIQPASTYGPLNHPPPPPVGAQEQWQPMQQPTSPQMMPERMTPHAAVAQPYGVPQHRASTGWTSDYGSTKLGSQPSPQPAYAQAEFVPPGNVPR